MSDTIFSLKYSIGRGTRGPAAAGHAREGDICCTSTRKWYEKQASNGRQKLVFTPASRDRAVWNYLLSLNAQQEAIGDEAVINNVDNYNLDVQNVG